MKFKLSKRARINSNLFAGAMFIGLAVYGFELPVTTVLAYLAICVSFLVVTVLTASGLGWAISRIRSRKVRLNKPDSDA
jgi:hypothetical protein